MKKRSVQILVLVGVCLVLITATVLATMQGKVIVLDPSGQIAEQQKDLFVFATVLSVLVITPVFTMLFMFMITYRESNKKARYEPNWAHNKYLEGAWLAIPLVIIGILAVVTWQSSHSLDPFRPLASDKKPIVVQAIAMEWRWLFVYPEYNIATLNYVQIPNDTPVEFRITADAPMNSLWIPALGGQIYAMAGMETRLHLKASETGSYLGRSANLSGEGFSGMTFSTDVTSLVDFDTWLKFTRTNQNMLDMNRYNELSEQSTDKEPQTFGRVEGDMFGAIIDSYNVPPLSLQQYESGKVGH